MRDKKELESDLIERLNLAIRKGQKNENQIWENLMSKLGFYYSTTADIKEQNCERFTINTFIRDFFLLIWPLIYRMKTWLEEKWENGLFGMQEEFKETIS